MTYAMFYVIFYCVLFSHLANSKAALIEEAPSTLGINITAVNVDLEEVKTISVLIRFTTNDNWTISKVNGLISEYFGYDSCAKPFFCANRMEVISERISLYELIIQTSQINVIQTLKKQLWVENVERNVEINGVTAKRVFLISDEVFRK